MSLWDTMMKRLFAKKPLQEAAKQGEAPPSPASQDQRYLLREEHGYMKRKAAAETPTPAPAPAGKKRGLDKLLKK